ncbi:aminotransferase class I/II-fold pyridoxal phosphate-dependent enzyme [Desulfuribacillus alkaliarsenatis]|uniref:C2H2-type domain-containing protein n=1 Tax=Desulfuribacillus alkaliarsenatis TaxID=766136 RepID=A0A1E5FZS1_9FIRM|nr:aminotransferase class I/II-fold pyridoxal phosphate-dependent enzyme [Desulfuribacillus alkaliarsenatis]OEF95736.1 hypothetical protein BHF68_11600 [Desulfuribacillus alkaliarsenatis]
MLNQQSRPLYEHLRKHTDEQTVRYHIPGHAGGAMYELASWQEIAKWDVTEIYGMDDLHSPNSVIKEAQQLAAKAYDAGKSYFLVNGTSSGLLASIHGLFRRGDTVLVQRNAHKSIYNALMLLGLEPQYLMPEPIEPETIASVVTPSILKTALDRYPEAKGVIITSPTFYGHAAEVASLSKLCHECNKLLIVDEAHGAHYNFHPQLKPYSALRSGADIVVQSFHKTLPALTMGSILHVNTRALGKIDMERLDYYISVFQTTSPSYVVMASLDFARHWGVHAGEAAIDKAITRKQQLCKQLQQIGIVPWDSHWEQSGLAIDPLKLTIPTNNINGKMLEQILASEQIYIELVSADHILLLLGLGMEQAADERLLNALIKLIDSSRADNPKLNNPKANNSKICTTDYPQLPQQSPIVAVPFSRISQEIYQESTHRVLLEQCIGNVIAEFVIPYPPGIPLLCPGEQITKEHIDYIYKAKKADIHFQGVTDTTLNSLKCYLKELL